VGTDIWARLYRAEHLALSLLAETNGDAARLILREIAQCPEDELEAVQDAYGPHPAGEFWVPHRLGGGAPTLAEANRMDLEEAAEKAARRAERTAPDEQPG